MYPKTIFLDENEEPPSRNAESSASRHPSQETSQSFRNRFFPDATQEDWNDWRWQLHNRITSSELLGTIIRLSENEQNSFHFQSTTLPLAITPYYASLLDPDNPEQPIRRSMVPVVSELLVSPGESPDPLGEESHSPVPGLIHRYPDRVLFLVTDSVVITDIGSMEILDQACEAVWTFRPMSVEDVRFLLAKIAEAAERGDFEPFKTSSIFDGTARHPEWRSS